MTLDLNLGLWTLKLDRCAHKLYTARVAMNMLEVPMRMGPRRSAFIMHRCWTPVLDFFRLQVDPN
jgi:hypothetical protein